MKKESFIFIITLFCIIGLCSGQEIVISVGDFNGNIIDRIYCGYKNGATDNLDSEFGEETIDDAVKKTGIYILQQNASNHNCLQDYSSSELIYFDESFTTKINYRDFDEEKDLYFELLIVNADSMGSITISMGNNTVPLNDFIDYSQTFYSACNEPVTPFFIEQLDFDLHSLHVFPQDPFNNDKLQHIIIKFKNNVTIQHYL